MSNVTVTVSQPNVTVSLANTSNVTVAQTTSNVVVSNIASVANANIITGLLSVTDTGGDGSLTYDGSGGFTYTGPSATEVRSHFSATAPITLSSGTIGIDASALFSNSDANNWFTSVTTDNLTQGASNIYFSTSGAAVNTDNLTQGTSNIYFSTSGAAVNTDNLPETATNQYFTTSRFNTSFAGKSTSDLSEGTNLYYTTARANTAIREQQSFLAYAGTLDTDIGNLAINNFATYQGNAAAIANDTIVAVSFTGNTVDGYPEIVPTFGMATGTGNTDFPAGNVNVNNALKLQSNIAGILGNPVGGNAYIRKVITKGAVQNVITAERNENGASTTKNTQSALFFPTSNVSGTPDFVLGNAINSPVTVTASETNGGTFIAINITNQNDNLTTFLAQFNISGSDFTANTAVFGTGGATKPTLFAGGQIYTSSGWAPTSRTVTYSNPNSITEPTLIYIPSSVDSDSWDHRTLDPTARMVVASTLGNANSFGLEITPANSTNNRLVQKGVLQFNAQPSMPDGSVFYVASANELPYAWNNLEPAVTANTDPTYGTDLNKRIAVGVVNTASTLDGTSNVLQNNGEVYVDFLKEVNLTTSGIEAVDHIATVPLTVGGNLTVNGNINATGNINYQNVTDLYVTDQKITLNANAATDATVEIIANRPVAGSSTLVRWNETSDVWQFTNDGSTFYNIPASTTDLAEGTNLYYTDGRFDTRLGTKSTTDLTEGTNLYYTTTRSNADFDTRLATKSTSDLSEGTNLYFTNGRFDTRLGTSSTTDLAEGTNLYYTSARTDADIADYTGTISTGNTISGTTVTATSGVTTNTIESQSGSNISLDSNTKAVKILKDFASVTNQDTLVLDSDGYRPTTYATSYPSYSGTGMRRNTTHYGTAVSGSAVLTVTESAVGFGTPSAGDRTNAFANLAANMMFVTRTGSSTTSPFPVGTRILSVDTINFTITMTQNAAFNQTFDANNTVRCGDGLYDPNQAYGELFYGQLDSTGSGSKDVIVAAIFTGSTDDVSYGVNGPQTADLTSSVPSGTVTVGDYSTQQRSKLTTNKGYTASKYGFTVGDGTTLSNRFENDNFPTKGINVMHDGQNTFSTDLGQTLVQTQIGLKQYTDNTTQASVLSYGPRIILSSAYGKNTDDPFTSYPRSGQSLGALTWSSTTGQTITPSSLRPPVYINAIASEDHDLGSNTNVYFGAMSNSDNTSSSNSAHVYLAVQDGRTVIASTTKGTTKEPIYFAPAQQPNPGYNPQNAYKFDTTSGQQAWAKVNYANTSASSGAEIEITNGQSRGAGVVGDMDLSFARANNYVAGTIITLTANWSPNNISGPFGLGINNYDAVLVQAGTDPGGYVDGSPVTIAGFTSTPWSGYNGQTKYLKFLGTFAGGALNGYEVYDDAALTTGFTSGSGTGNYGPGTFTFDSTLYSGVTAKKWTMSLEEQSDNLKLQDDGTTKVEFTGNTSIFSSIVRFQSFTTTEINALVSPQAGDTVFNTTIADICFYDGSAWQKVNKAPM